MLAVVGFQLHDSLRVNSGNNTAMLLAHVGYKVATGMDTNSFLRYKSQQRI